MPRPERERDGRVEEESCVLALGERIAALSRGRLHPQELDPDAHLLDQGYLDSLSYVEFLLCVERDWGVSVPETQFIGRLHTLRALAQHLAASTPR